MLKAHETADDLTSGWENCKRVLLGVGVLIWRRVLHRELASALPSLTRQSSTAMRLNISGLTRMAELNSLQLRWILAMGTCEFVFAISTENCGIPLGRVPAGPCATEISFFDEHLSIFSVADPFTALTYYNYRSSQIQI
jgi:hypothetical protein